MCSPRFGPRRDEKPRLAATSELHVLVGTDGLAAKVPHGCLCFVQGCFFGVPHVGNVKVPKGARLQLLAFVVFANMQVSAGSQEKH